MVMKLDVEATLAAFRKTAESIGAIDGQNACELAVNRDGIEVLMTFAQWRIEKTIAFGGSSGTVLADVFGMMLGQLTVLCLSAFEEDSQPLAIERISYHLNSTVVAGLAGDGIEVEAVEKDVGDA